MTTALALTLILIFLFISGLHIYWAFGGQWGNSAVLPTRHDNAKVIMPGIIPTLTVAFGLLCLAAVVFLNAFDVQPAGLAFLHKYGMGAIAAIFFLRAVGDFNYIGFFKKIRNTRFARNDTKYYSPLCLMIGILAILLEIYK